MVQNMSMKQYPKKGLFYKATEMPSVIERFKTWLAAGFRGVW